MSRKPKHMGLYINTRGMVYLTIVSGGRQAVLDRGVYILPENETIFMGEDRYIGNLQEVWEQFLTELEKSGI